MPVNLKQVPLVVLGGITNAKGMLRTKIMTMRMTRAVADILNTAWEFENAA